MISNVVAFVIVVVVPVPEVKRNIDWEFNNVKRAGSGLYATLSHLAAQKCLLRNYRYFARIDFGMEQSINL